MRNLAQEYLEEKQDFGEEWTFLRYPLDGELRWEPFQYFPEAHYRKAYDQLRREHWPEVRTDGGYADLHNGKKQAKVYYWLDPDTGAALYHTGVNDEETIPFFPDEDAAMVYLEKRAEHGDKEAYKGLSLYKARTRKVGDAVDVLTDQSGIADFVPDGGVPAPRHQYTDYLRSLAESDDLHTAMTYQTWLEEELTEMWEEHGSPYLRSDGGMQIENPAPDRVWFWYNPSIDNIVQEEVEPYDVRGIFRSEHDARQFLDWYAEQYDVDNTSHLELYSADIELEGHGRKHFLADGTDREPEMPEQVDFSEYRPP